MYSYMTGVRFKDHTGRYRSGTVVGRTKDGKHWVRVQDSPMPPVYWANKLHKFDYYDALVSTSDMEVLGE